MDLGGRRWPLVWGTGSERLPGAMVPWGPGGAPSTLLVSECPSLRTLQEFVGDTNHKAAGVTPLDCPLPSLSKAHVLRGVTFQALSSDSRNAKHFVRFVFPLS